MPDQLSAAETAKLFNAASKALRDDDSEKLSTLLTEETSKEEAPVEDTLTEEEDTSTEVEEESTESEEQSEDEDKDKLADDPASEDKDDKKDDPLEALRAEIAELKKAQQTARSQFGRVSAIQSRLDKYDKKLAELTQSTSSQPSDKIDPEVQAALKDLEDTDPVLAATLSKAIGTATNKTVKDSTAREIEHIQSLRDIEYADYVEEQRSVLLSKYPNANEVFQSDSWKSWKKAQPRHILDLATSDSADAVAMALGIYRDDMIRQHPELAPKKEEVVVDDRASKIEEERKKKQAESANLGTAKPPARSKEPTDPEALFRQYSESIRKDIRGR